MEMIKLEEQQEATIEQEVTHIEDALYEIWFPSIKTWALKCSLPNCEAMFADEAERAKHLTETHRVFIYPCMAENCCDGFNQLSHLSQHILLNHCEWPIEAICRRCAVQFESYQDLRQHMLIYHEEGLFQCRHLSSCDFLGNTRNIVVEHTNEHIKFGQYQEEEVDEEHNPLLSNKDFKKSLKDKLKPPEEKIPEPVKTYRLTTFRPSTSGLPSNVVRTNAGKIVKQDETGQLTLLNIIENGAKGSTSASSGAVEDLPATYLSSSDDNESLEDLVAADEEALRKRRPRKRKTAVLTHSSGDGGGGRKHPRKQLLSPKSPVEAVKPPRFRRSTSGKSSLFSKTDSNYVESYRSDEDTEESDVPEEPDDDEYDPDYYEYRVEKQHNGDGQQQRQRHAVGIQFAAPTSSGNKPVKITATTTAREPRLINVRCCVEDCGEVLDSQEKFNDHLVQTHNVQPFACLIEGCGKTFSTITTFSNHLTKNHTNAGLFPCSLCYQAFQTGSQLVEHATTMHYLDMEGMFECSEPGCSHLGSTRRTLINHSVEVHVPNRHVCPRADCDTVFAERRQLNAHLRTAHRQIKPFRCTWSGCHFHALRENGLLTHVRSVHFKLPATVEEQEAQGIVDDRDPREYMEIIAEAIIPAADNSAEQHHQGQQQQVQQHQQPHLIEHPQPNTVYTLDQNTKFVILNPA